MSPSVLCLGEVLFDLIAAQVDTNVKQVTSWTPYPGGAPANVACGLVKLGTSSAFIGCVGQDLAGDKLVSLLQTTGVNTTGIQYHSTAPTRQVYVTRSGAGERHFAGFGDIPTTDFADTHLLAEYLPESLFKNAQYLVLGTLELAYSNTRKAILKSLKLAQQYRVKVLVDINWRPVFWTDITLAPPIILQVLQYADIIKCSDDEACWLWATDNPIEIKEKLDSVSGVLVTAGAQGCHYSLGNYSGHIPAFSVQSIDTTGAGDGFVAGFLHQCCQQGEQVFQQAEVAKSAIIYGSAVGALVTTQLGAIASQPTAQAVQAFLSSQLNL